MGEIFLTKITPYSCIVLLLGLNIRESYVNICENKKYSFKKIVTDSAMVKSLQGIEQFELEEVLPVCTRCPNLGRLLHTLQKESKDAIPHCSWKQMAGRSSIGKQMTSSTWNSANDLWYHWERTPGITEGAGKKKRERTDLPGHAKRQNCNWHQLNEERRHKQRRTLVQVKDWHPLLHQFFFNWKLWDDYFAV